MLQEVRSSHRSITFAALLAMAACTLDGAEPLPEEANHVIAVVPMTGEFSAAGVSRLRALMLGLSQVEAVGELARPIRLHLIDAGAQDQVETEDLLRAQLEELTIGGVRHVAAIVTSGTLALKASAPIALLDQIPYFEVSSGRGLDEVTLDAAADRTFAFRVGPLAIHEPRLITNLLAARQGEASWGRVSLLRGQYVHDKMLTRSMLGALEAAGQAGRLTSPGVVEMPNEGPFEPFIDQAMLAGADIIYYAVSGDDANLAFLRAARDRGFAGKLITSDQLAGAGLLEPDLAAYLAEGTTSDEGRHFMSRRGPSQGPVLAAFEADLAVATGLAPEPFAAFAYDAGVLVGLGLVATQGSGGDALRDQVLASSTGGTPFGYGQLADVVAAIRAGQDVDYSGVSGWIDFAFDDIHGQVTPSSYHVETAVPVSPTAPAGYRTLPSPVGQY